MTAQQRERRNADGSERGRKESAGYTASSSEAAGGKFEERHQWPGGGAIGGAIGDAINGGATSSDGAINGSGREQFFRGGAQCAAGVKNAKSKPARSHCSGREARPNPACERATANTRWAVHADRALG